MSSVRGCIDVSLHFLQERRGEGSEHLPSRRSHRNGAAYEDELYFEVSCIYMHIVCVCAHVRACVRACVRS